MTRQDILEKYEPRQENLLLILHDIQNNNPGQNISGEDIRTVASYLNITNSSVYGVVTYYSMFSLKPRGMNIIRVCSSPVCGMTDSEGLFKQLEQLLAIKAGETTADGMFTLETSECLGKCDEAPCMIINEEFYGRLNAEDLPAVINSIRRK